MKPPYIPEMLIRTAQAHNSEECLFFSGTKDRKGYGRLYTGRHSYALVHRYVYEKLIGAIAEGIDICHRCDTPPCYNLRHLFAGTQKDNSLDMVSKGRARASKGEANSMARLSNSDILKIRSLAGQLGQRSIAEMFGIDQSNVSCIVRRKTWAHILHQ